MRKTNIFLKGFLSANFFRHSAGIAVFMLFTISIMSFRDGKTFENVKKALKSTSDSSSNNSTKAFANLLTDPLADNTALFKTVFKINPAIESFVKEYTRKETEEYTDMKVWGKPYFDIMDEILAKNGLPVQLKYICVIESNLKANTVSHSGATGPWQLMADEGRMFGLVMKKGHDERKDYVKSTEVAAGLFKQLYSQYGDWLMVIAAYNCGTGAMRRAIAKAGTKNYWKVQNFLSAQARNQVKKYIATHYIFEGCGGWTTVSKEETAECQTTIAGLSNMKDTTATADNTATIEISGKYNSGVLINTLLIEDELFNKLNPGIDKELLQGKTYKLTLPKEKMPLFQSNRQQILEQSVQLFISAAVNK